jgi:hypothetical protein
MNAINKFLFWTSGARISVINLITRQEKSRFILIGISLLISSIVSILSASYAIILISQNLFSSILIGLMWGILIFHLNRLLISSILESRNNVSKSTIWFSSSIIIALFLSYTISTPLQLMLFESEVNNQINKNRIESILPIENEYENKINEEYTELNQLRDLYHKEVAGIKGRNETGLSSGVIGKGASARMISERIVDKEKLIEKLRIEKSYLRNDIFKDSSSFVERTNSLSQIRNQNSFINSIYYFLFCFFFLIEITPFLVVILSKKSSYENLLDDIDNIHSDNLRENQKEKDSFINFCNQNINQVNTLINSQNYKAKEQLRYGLLISILGILAYLGYGTFLFVIYFNENEFRNHHVFLFSTLSVVFFFMQFLGGWYLKQFRNTTNYSNSLFDKKEKYNQLLLGRIAIKEEANNKNLAKIKLIFELLSSTKIDNAIIEQNDKNENFAKEVIDSLNELKELIKKSGGDSVV